MKKWKKPNITGVKLDRTESQFCECITNDSVTTFTTGPDKNVHYCHRDNMWHRNNCSSWNEGHHQCGSNCPTGGNHEWAGQSHKSNCCCGGSQSS